MPLNKEETLKVLCQTNLSLKISISSLQRINGHWNSLADHYLCITCSITQLMALNQIESMSRREIMVVALI